MVVINGTIAHSEMYFPRS